MDNSQLGPNRPLTTELETFQRLLPEMLEHHPGRFALIHLRDLVSVWDTEGDAIQTGHKLYGAKEPFLVKRILALEVPVEITRITVPESNPQGL